MQEDGARGYRRPYTAAMPRVCSIFSSRLYLHTRSVRAGAPVLICPAFSATAMSAMEGVLGFPAAVGEDGAVAVLLGEPHRPDGLGQGADLIGLDQNRIGAAGSNALLEAGGVGDEQVIPHDLHPGA